MVKKEKLNNSIYKTRNYMSKDFKEDFEINAGGFYDGGISVSDEEERLEKELAPYEKKRKTKLLICFIAFFVFLILALVLVLPGINQDNSTKIFIGGISSILAVIFAALVIHYDI